tara:strand:- start:2843 stop:3184 length:342 start_codon:yes stop_codon:yes gene_type:complete
MDLWSFALPFSFEASSVKEIIRQSGRPKPRAFSFFLSLRTNKNPTRQKKKETTIYYSVHSNKTRHHIDAQNGLSSCARESRRRRQIARQKKLAPSSFSRARKRSSIEKRSSFL